MEYVTTSRQDKRAEERREEDERKGEEGRGEERSYLQTKVNLAILRAGGKKGREEERNSCIKYDNVTQDEEAFVQYKSHQAHRREQEARGKKERTTEGFTKREEGEKEKELGTFSRPQSP